MNTGVCMDINVIGRRREMCVYVYIFIYVHIYEDERERERDSSMCT